jgi:hypothetical protein
MKRERGAKERNKTGILKSSLCSITHHTAKNMCENGGTFPPILNFGTRWRWVVRFALGLFTPGGMSPRFPTGQEIGWALDLVWMLCRRD